MDKFNKTAFVCAVLLALLLVWQSIFSIPGFPFPDVCAKSGLCVLLIPILIVVLLFSVGSSQSYWEGYNSAMKNVANRYISPMKEYSFFKWTFILVGIAFIALLIISLL